MKERLTLLTLKEVAQFLSLSEKTMYRLVKARTLPALKIGGQWRFEQNALDAWLEKEINEAVAKKRWRENRPGPIRKIHQ